MQNAQNQNDIHTQVMSFLYTNVFPNTFKGNKEDEGQILPMNVIKTVTMKKALVGNWLKQAPMLEPKKQFPLIKYFPIVKNLIEKTVFETDANQTKPILMFTPSLLPPCLICIFFSLPTNFLGLTFVVGGYSFDFHCQLL